MIVGIAGHIGAGKDTVARCLIGRYGFERIGMSDALKAEVKRILPRTLAAYAAERGGDIDHMLHVERTPVTRALLQEWGTELRRVEDPDYWVKAWARSVDGRPRVVTPDIRFANEAIAVRAAKGYLAKVVRPGHDGDTHASEHGLEHWNDWDILLINDRSPEALWQNVERWCRHLGL